MPRYRSSRRRGERRRSKSVFNPVSLPALVLGIGVLVYFAFQFTSDPVGKARASAFNRVQQQFHSPPQPRTNDPPTPHYQSHPNYPNLAPAAAHPPPPPPPSAVNSPPLAASVVSGAAVAPAAPPVSQQAPQPPPPLVAPPVPPSGPNVPPVIPVVPVTAPASSVVPAAAPSAAAASPAALVAPSGVANGPSLTGIAAGTAPAGSGSLTSPGATPAAAAVPSPVTAIPLEPKYVVLDPNAPLPTKSAPPQTFIPIIKNPSPVDTNNSTEVANEASNDDNTSSDTEDNTQEETGNEASPPLAGGANDTSSATEGDENVVVDDTPGSDSNSTDSATPEGESATPGNETSTGDELSTGNEATNGSDNSTVALTEEESTDGNNGTEASTSIGDADSADNSANSTTPAVDEDASAENNTSSSAALTSTLSTAENKSEAVAADHEEKHGSQNRDASHESVTVKHNQHQYRIPRGSRVTGKLPDFLGVVPTRGGMVRGQNVTRVSYALYKIVNLFGFNSMIDSPASSHLEWMSEMMQRIEFDRPMFQYFGIDADCAQLDKVRDAIGIIGSAVFKCTDDVPENSGADVLFYWPELKEIANVKEFAKKLESIMKQAKFNGINYIIVPQYPAVKDRKVIYTYGRWKLDGDDDGTLPFLLNEHLRGIVPVQQPTPDNQYLLYMTFYALKPLPFY